MQKVPTESHLVIHKRFYGHTVHVSAVQEIKARSRSFKLLTLQPSDVVDEIIDYTMVLDVSHFHDNFF